MCSTLSTRIVGSDDVKSSHYLGSGNRLPTTTSGRATDYRLASDQATYWWPNPFLWVWQRESTSMKTTSDRRITTWHLLRKEIIPNSRSCRRLGSYFISTNIFCYQSEDLHLLRQRYFLIRPASSSDDFLMIRKDVGIFGPNLERPAWT